MLELQTRVHENDDDDDDGVGLQSLPVLCLREHREPQGDLGEMPVLPCAYYVPR